MSHMQTELSIQELDKAMKATSDKNMYKRYQAVRLHFDGLMNIDIANIIQVHPQTVGIYIRKYKEQGLSALTPAPKPGAPPKLSGSLSIVGVSILPYAEIEQYYFMNNCYVCIYK